MYNYKVDISLRYQHKCFIVYRHYNQLELSSFQYSDGPPQSWDDDPANFSILLGVWVSNHHLLQIACGYILGLYKAPDVYSHGSLHSTMRMLWTFLSLAGASIYGLVRCCMHEPCAINACAINARPHTKQHTTTMHAHLGHRLWLFLKIEVAQINSRF